MFMYFPKNVGKLTTIIFWVLSQFLILYFDIKQSPPLRLKAKQQYKSPWLSHQKHKFALKL